MASQPRALDRLIVGVDSRAHRRIGDRGRIDETRLENLFLDLVQCRTIGGGLLQRLAMGRERRASGLVLFVFGADERIGTSRGFGRGQCHDEIGGESGAAQHDPSPGGPVGAAQRYQVRGKARVSGMLHRFHLRLRLASL